jgi:hypothetical protein
MRFDDLIEILSQERLHEAADVKCRCDGNDDDDWNHAVPGTAAATAVGPMPGTR